MVAKGLTFLILLFCGAQTRAQLCIPDPVEDVVINDESFLEWSPSENCPDTMYIIRIEADGSFAYEYVITDLKLSVSFLPLCREYKLIVTPMSQNILGVETHGEWGRPLTEDVDISIRTFAASQIDDDVLIQWLVDTNYRYCVDSYELRIWNEDAADPVVYEQTEYGFLIEYVAQCMFYKFEITPLYSGKNGITGQFNYTVPAKTNRPSLVEVRQDSLSINTTWSLEKYYENRCSITALYVNGTRFNATYEIEDTPERPDVQVSIGGLHANSMYYFNVSVDNSAGVSEAVQLAVQTLPIDLNIA